MRDAPHMASRDTYEKYYVDVGEGPAFQVGRFNPGRMAHFHPKVGESILDLGCGTGGSLAVYGRKCSVVGVELSSSMARTARKTLRQIPPVYPVEVIEGWIEDFDDPRRFDHVIITEVLEHVFSPVEVLKVAAKHLKPTGEVYISAPSVVVGGPSHVRGVPFSDLEVWLEKAGLRSIWNIEEPHQIGETPYMRTMCKAVLV